MGSIMIRGRMAQIRPHNRSATRYNDGYQRELQMKKIEMERMRRSLELLYTDRYRQRYYRPQSRSYLDYDPEERRRYEMMYGDQYGYRLREQQFRRAHAPPSHADLHSEEVRKNLKWEEIKLRARLASIQEELQKGPRINPNNSSLDDVQPIHEFVPSKSISSSTNSDEDAILPHDSFSESPKEGESSRSLLILVKDADPTEGNAEPSADNSSPVADDISPVIEAIEPKESSDSWEKQNGNVDCFSRGFLLSYPNDDDSAWHRGIQSSESTADEEACE